MTEINRNRYKIINKNLYKSISYHKLQGLAVDYSQNTESKTKLMEIRK